MSNTDATDAEHADSTPSIGRELSDILSGKNPLKNLTVAQTGPYHYTVMSARNGSATMHRVDLRTRECTCEDMEHNNKLPAVCAHLAKASLVHPQMDGNEVGTAHLMTVTQTLRNEVDEIKELRREADSAAKEAGAKARAAEASQTAAETVESWDAEEASEKVEEAFEAAGFDVKFIGPDHNDDSQLAYAIGHSDFDEVKRVTSKCDLVGYNGSNNTLPVDDARQYINEVIQA